MDMHTLNFTILELELFSFLSIKAGEKLSQRETAQQLHVSPTAVSNAVKVLAEKGLCKIEKAKTINFISFNRDSKRAIELKRVENVKLVYTSGLSNFLEESLPGTTIIIFGSYAKGEDTAGSDIDIAVIGRKEKKLALENFEKLFSREIRVNFYDSWKGIHKHLKNNILNGIILHGGVEL